MLPKISRNKKVLKEIQEYTEMLSKISNPQLKKEANNTLKKLRQEFENIDNFFLGNSGGVSPDLARDAAKKTVEYRKYLRLIKERLERR
mgnify:CR=1 FL=1